MPLLQRLHHSPEESVVWSLSCAAGSVRQDTATLTPVSVRHGCALTNISSCRSGVRDATRSDKTGKTGVGD